MTVTPCPLTGVPETMLWTLHNRANEAARPDGVLKDEMARRIYRSIDYDYERSFGKADPSHGVRSAVFDADLRAFLARHPDGVIVNLGEGLETQRFRVEGDRALWISVDVPEAIAIRERFITPDETHRHVPLSVLDPAWFDAVPPGRPVRLTAQGLLMYFEPDDLARLLQGMAHRFPGAWFMFDHIPRWFSNRTMRERGYRKTPHYTAPRMPWGINRDEMVPTLRGWVPDLAAIETVPFPWPRGLTRWILRAWEITPGLRNHCAGITRLRFADAPHAN
ncbi:class I SAM-dependent methyltransferase [Pararhodospirillum oryzae]|uniref:Putative O-methyltransferase n=1 Tax=Pararhodospirillum oryzae TaxID=478448 RepID=A0A512H339_9PROT|nr:class I SAM-dependent methyltransferase [Pararhodospirillum oryzae]GEO79877.1 putative O-methyltransferase [Pararhodospirillum oryzae]